MANVAFRGTPKQERELRKFIKKHKDQPGAMMPVLQEAQGIYGYLPREVQMIIAEEMGVPLSRYSELRHSIRSSPCPPRASTLSVYVSEQPVTSRALTRFWPLLRNASGSKPGNAPLTASSPLTAAGVLAPAAWLPS